MVQKKVFLPGEYPLLWLDCWFISHCLFFPSPQEPQGSFLDLHSENLVEIQKLKAHENVGALVNLQP